MHIEGVIAMSSSNMYDYGYGKLWNDVHVERRSGYSTSVTDFHKHSFYEINLILSGNIKILLQDRFEEGTENKIVLTRPGTAHFISCKPDTLYSRIYLVFTEEFITEFQPAWYTLSMLFGKSGTILTLTPDEANFFCTLIEQIEKERSNPAKGFLMGYFLCKLSELYQTEPLKKDIQPYVFEALTYIERHYAEKINFSEMAKQLYIGRTTLMTDFKAYIGITVGEYLTKCRLKHSIQLLLQKKTIEYVSEKCGFSDSSGFIRAFKRIYGTTPHKYIKNLIF